MSEDFAEVFTIAVRHVVPLARRRGMSFAFDCQSKGLRFTGGLAALQGSLHRLFLELVGMVRGGSLVISARAMDLNGAPRIFVHVAGVGPMAPAQEIHATCERMHLDLIEPPSAAPGEIAAHGLCPQTMDTIDLSVLPGEGALITLALSSVEATQDDHEPDHDAHGAGAWLINVDDALARSWTRRLQRLGWAVSRFSSYQAAMDQLHNVPRSARPALVIVLETGNPAKDGALDLAALLPGWSRLVYAVETGSITLRRPQDVSGYEVHVYPLSPHDLQVITDDAGQHDTGSGNTVPMPLAAPDMPRVLIVDDVALNRVVGQALAEALGYSVQTARDGLEAIEACKHKAPHAVLMDMDMPGLGGIDAIRHLRLLQKEGSIPPFPITIVTAGWTPKVREDVMTQ